jgi:ribokinase
MFIPVSALGATSYRSGNGQKMPLAHVIGSINRDIVATVERHPAPGETVLGDTVAMFPGGKGANQAVAIARLGGQARLIGRIGFDAFGAELVKFLRGEGVDVAFVKAVDRAATGLALITVDAKSENAITVIPGANHVWTGGLGEIRARPDDIVVCQLEIPLAIVQAAFLQAKEAGAMTVLNPAPYQQLSPAILVATDILILNETELSQMAGPDTIDTANIRDVGGAATRLLERGPKLIVVTRGAKGALLKTRDGDHREVPGLAVRAIDTTGAGDCFVGAFVAELMHGASPENAAAFANRAASLSVTKPGAAASFPTRAEM